MVDKVYKKNLPALRNALEELRENFSNLSSRTDWIKLRIEPLLKHLRSLEQLLESEEFSREFSHLTKGVELFHSDLSILEQMLEGWKRFFSLRKNFLGEKTKEIEQHSGLSVSSLTQQVEPSFLVCVRYGAVAGTRTASGESSDFGNSHLKMVGPVGFEPI